MMIKILGKPKPESLKFITNEHALKYIQDMPETPKRRPTDGIKYENDLALDLIDKCLEFDPSQRCTVEDALKHPYFEELHDPSDEPVYEKKLDFIFEEKGKFSLHQLKCMIIDEINLVNKNANEDVYDTEAISKGFTEEVQEN